MTIAACAVTGEGIVLGADSTSTMTVGQAGDRYLHNEQKLFQVGENSTLGIVTWGVGRLGSVSHRTLVAELADELAASPPADVKDAAERFARKVWSHYVGDPQLQARIATHKQVIADNGATADAKEKARGALMGLSLGFCVAGHCLPKRVPEAYELLFHPDLAAAPPPKPAEPMQFWGANLFIYRLLGFDGTVAEEVWRSGKWTGDRPELDLLFAKHRTPLLTVPIRETVDAIHALLHTTIKVMKFTSVPPVCGGRIELATVTTDRRFRWVRHKTLGAALDRA